MINTTENTPKHCHKCWKFEECNQAQNMCADTEAVKGGIAFYELSPGDSSGECVCRACYDSGETQTDYEKFSSLDYEELDSPAHCINCGVPLIHILTIEGIRFVRKAITEGTGCCRELWPVVWAEVLSQKGYDHVDSREKAQALGGE